MGSYLIRYDDLRPSCYTISKLPISFNSPRVVSIKAFTERIHILFDNPQNECPNLLSP